MPSTELPTCTSAQSVSSEKNTRPYYKMLIRTQIEVTCSYIREAYVYRMGHTGVTTTTTTVGDIFYFFILHSTRLMDDAQKIYARNHRARITDAWRREEKVARLTTSLQKMVIRLFTRKMPENLSSGQNHVCAYDREDSRGEREEME